MLTRLALMYCFWFWTAGGAKGSEFGGVVHGEEQHGCRAGGQGLLREADVSRMHSEIQRMFLISRSLSFT